MTGHIAELIEEWRKASTDPKRSPLSRERFRLRLTELEAARDADCAKLRESVAGHYDHSPERAAVERCILSLGGKP